MQKYSQRSGESGKREREREREIQTEVQRHRDSDRGAETQRLRQMGRDMYIACAIAASARGTASAATCGGRKCFLPAQALQAVVAVVVVAVIVVVVVVIVVVKV